jgi:chlorite dismutase
MPALGRLNWSNASPSDRAGAPQPTLRKDEEMTTAPPSAESSTHQEEPARLSSRQINEQIRYTGWLVLSRLADLAIPADEAAAEVTGLIADLATTDVTVRGLYDVSALRADADLMVWWHGPTAESLQVATRRLRRTAAGRATTPAWAAMGLHRPAEFNKGHVPAFLAGMAPREWVAVYPFVRSYDWYLLPDEDRRRMLADHGKMARGFPDVRANTVASFSLGDYEWILAFEADELYRIVDLMRHLRASEARLYVREEVPFYTGRRRAVADLVAGLA